MSGNKRCWFLACFLVGVVTCFQYVFAEARAGELPLTIDFNGVKLEREYPVTGGAPLARGALNDARAVRLDIDGKSIPVQAKALAFWPDGSVKWLLLDFQTIPSDSKEILLHYGAGVKAIPVPEGKGIVASANNNEVIVDTGSLKFRVMKGGCGFIDEISYRGKSLKAAGRRLNLMDAIHTKSPADYHPIGRYIRDGKEDPSRISVTGVSLETSGPLRATVLIEGKYQYKYMGSTIKGTSVKGDCPFRIRIHAYAGQSILKIEHFFYYEGDGDHDFIKSLALKVPLQNSERTSVKYIGTTGERAVKTPFSGLYQQTADQYQVWRSQGRAAATLAKGRRFEGIVDVTNGSMGVSMGIRDFWQNAAKALHVDLKNQELSACLWPIEAPPLDFRRHAREWSVGESGEPGDSSGTSPQPLPGTYRLASKGVGKTHYVMLNFHDPADASETLLAMYKLFNHRPLLWAKASHYAESLALGRYRERVLGEHDDVEKILDSSVDIFKFSQERFRWYGFWLYGNVASVFNNFRPHGRWERELGRWGWGNGDTVGRLAYALMLQAVRKCQRDDVEFAEKYLYNIHDVCSTHTPSYPHHYTDNFRYIKGAAHRHGAWPWAGPYVGIRGAHPVGAKIYYFLTGEGHAKDILEEITELALKNPGGGEGDGPLGPNAQIFLYKWETTGDTQWRDRLKAEIDNSELLKTAKSGWLVMMSAAFGIHDALEEYMELTGDETHKSLIADYADRAMPAKMKNHWTWGGYFRVYSSAYNATGNEKYKNAMEEMLKVLDDKTKWTLALKVPKNQWMGKDGGFRIFIDGNIIRDIPFVLYSLHQADLKKEKK